MSTAIDHPSPIPASESLPPYDSVLIVSFGGPEGRDDVMPFLENVLRGKNVPRERLLEVAEHYQKFSGVSPINQQCRDLISALRAELDGGGIDLPIYWGNRNWHPLLADTLQTMAKDGRKRALAFFTSMFSCYSGCRQYRENISAAQAKVVGESPIIEKLRMGYNHPGFIEPLTELLHNALASIPDERRSAAVILFTAHSIPMSMAERSAYKSQLLEASRLVAESEPDAKWELVFQSRSGPPTQPWLEPDVCDRIKELAARGVKDVVLHPIGFISDHMEVIYDLDTEAMQLCQSLNVACWRVPTVGIHPRFVQMIRELIEERLSPRKPRLAVGAFPTSHDFCPENCCLYSAGRS